MAKALKPFNSRLVGIEELSVTSSTSKDDSIFDPFDPNNTRATTNSNVNTSDTQEPVQSSTSPDSPLGLGSLGRLPSEIRNVIYKKLMVVDKMIEDVYKLVGTKKVVMEADCPRIKGLRVTILRTSRAIYQEGLPILYGWNSFFFRKPSHLEIFAYEELLENGWKPVFGLETKEYGRLSLIRPVGLNIGANSKGQRRKLDRKAIWETW
ncbi:hypothetical protein OEA41_001034 [Lepraria neglecta]|uniref:Uncharacterized protein n=1 Tax=Lepraria neglecta TaxID=209136 RepID=A0AAD9ZJL1_9LECA|nr:hypothetical protein OEA41_001034 [Lepraria neglecta]